MASSDSDIYQKLLEQISILEATSRTIKTLSMQLNGHRRASIDSIPSDASSDNAQSNAVTADKVFRFHGEEPTRALGYVNWNSSHDVLAENLQLVLMVDVRKSLKNLKEISPRPNLANNQQVAIYNNMTQKEANKNENGLFMFEITMVSKEYRFPQDAVYVNIKSPKVQEEMSFLAKLHIAPTDGVVERFLNIVESEMYTCGSFEKKYGLKWV